MNTTYRQSPPVLLAAGDGLALLIVTWIGFASHSESLLNVRWLYTFLPLAGAWALASPWLGVYRHELRCSGASIWRAMLAAVLAVPLATWMRGVLIAEVSTPVIFTAVMMAVSALGIGAWRTIWWWICKRNGSNGRS